MRQALAACETEVPNCKGFSVVESPKYYAADLGRFLVDAPYIYALDVDHENALLTQYKPAVKDEARLSAHHKFCKAPWDEGIGVEPYVP